MNKIFIVLFLVLGFVVPIVSRSCYNLTDNGEASMEAKKYTMDIKIDEYGDMHVVEKIVIDNYTDSYNNYFYKEIAYNKNNMFGNSSLNKSKLREDARLIVEDDSGVVYDSDTSLGTYPSHFAGFSYNNDLDERGYRIRCENASSSYCDSIFYYNRPGFARITTFTYEYTIEGVITQYDDISEFNWVLLDYQPFKFYDININIELPEGNYDIAGEETFFHGTNLAKREFSDNNKIVITADDMVSDEQIEVRLLLDNEVFDNVREKNKVQIDALEDILSFEKKQAEIADKKYFIGNIGTIIVYILFVLGIVAFGLFVYKKYDKERKSEFYNEYYRELPADYPPAIMGYLYKFREIDDDDLTATLLDLIRKKYLILDAKGSSGVNDKNPDYIIKLNEEKDQKGLSDSEKYLIRWFVREIGDGEKVSSRQLNSYCDTYDGAIKYQNSCNTWYKLVKSEGNKYKFFDNTVHKFKGVCCLLAVLFAMVFFFLLTVMSVSSGYVLGKCLSCGILCFLGAFVIYVNGVDRRSEKGNEDFVRWKAFKKFLEEFGSFEDYPVPSLIIWEHYLVYATSFGIADKVSEQLKLKLNLEEIASVDNTFVVYFGLEHRIGGFNSSIRRMSHNSRATITRHTAQRTGGSFGGRSGGGGFSGGSSFGGGGGSFGGGRR